MSRRSSARAIDSSSNALATAGPKPVRCAIYCRKSTEEGLELAFNSLDAQRESAANYIASMRSEGWLALPERYEDGGYTGANLERPAVARLLAEITAGKVDCVVVYKVDRLSRSLMDFARLLELFETKKVAFVSVTQQLSTTNSMGRLMLNVLLSFAQFERELVSERTRDKIAAARRKGKWSGGRPILGYDIEPGTRRLMVNPVEAERLRAIFRLYLSERSLVRTARLLNERGWTTKSAITVKGTPWGGRPWDKVNLYLLLTNVGLIGKVKHKENIYPGEHPAVVDADLFQQVQTLLSSNGVKGGMHVRNQHGALLKGLLYCRPCNTVMGHAYSVKGGGRVYRYYICNVAQKRGRDACPTRSLPAEQIEALVLEQVRRIATDPEVLSQTLLAARNQRAAMVESTRAELTALATTNRALRNRVAEVAPQAAADPGAARELAELIAEMERVEHRSLSLRDNVAAAESDIVAKADVDTALSEFHSTWTQLAPLERARIVRTLVRRVEYDPKAGTVSVQLHSLSLRHLDEMSTPLETAHV